MWLSPLPSVTHAVILLGSVYHTFRARSSGEKAQKVAVSDRSAAVIFCIFQRCANRNMTHGESKWRKSLLLLCLDFFGSFFRLNIVLVWRDHFKLIRTPMNFCNSFQNQVGILRRHCIEFTNSFMSIKVFNRAQIRIQLVNNCMDFQIRKSRTHFVCRIYSERILPT